MSLVYDPEYKLELSKGLTELDNIHLENPIYLIDLK